MLPVQPSRNIMAFELQVFRGSPTEVQYFEIVKAAISFVCTRIRHPNTYDEISQRDSPRGNVDLAMRQQAVSFDYAHEIGQLLIQAAIELIPRSLTAPQPAMRKNVPQEQGRVHQKLEYWQSVCQMRGDEGTDQCNSRGAARILSQAPTLLQGHNLCGVGVSAPTNVPEQALKSNENALHVVANQSLSHLTMAKEGRERSKLPIAARAISKRAKKYVKCLPSSGKPAKKQSGSKANIPQIAADNCCVLSSLVTHKASGGTSSATKQDMDRPSEALHRSVMPAEIKETSADAAQYSHYQAKYVSGHRHGRYNAFYLQAQIVSRAITDLSSALVPVETRPAKIQIENGSDVIATGAQNANHAPAQAAFHGTKPPTCPSILATARVRRNGVSTNFPALGVSSGMCNPLSFPVQASSSGMNHTSTPSSSEHSADSAKQYSGACTAPTNVAFSNSPGGIPDNLERHSHVSILFALGNAFSTCQRWKQRRISGGKRAS